MYEAAIIFAALYAAFWASITKITANNGAQYLTWWLFAKALPVCASGVILMEMYRRFWP